MKEPELTALLRGHAARHSVPGAAVGVLCNGRVTAAYHGVAEVGPGTPVTSDTLFSLGSLTKSMLATVIARLANAGRLSLDDPVAAHVPELRGRPWAETASIRDLLANQSGLPLTTALEFDFDGRKDEDEGAISRLAAQVSAEVGSAKFWSYTNAGWSLLGRAIETVTGVPWEDAMQMHLADLALSHTSFEVGTARSARVTGYDVTAQGIVPVEPLASRAYGPAGANAVSTVADVLRFAALHLADPSLAALREEHGDLSLTGWFDAWCLGLARFDWPGGPVWGWDGMVAGQRSVLRILPRQNAAIVLMTNGSTGRAMARTLFAEVVPSLFGVQFSQLNLQGSAGAAGDLSRFAGVYAWPDRRVEVTAAGDRLMIDERAALPIDERTFLLDASDPDNPTVAFGSFDAAGRPNVLYLMVWGLPRVE